MHLCYCCSRSQCIINIRYAADETKGEMESLPCEAALTFVDLAGAEREKKTGNKVSYHDPGLGTNNKTYYDIGNKCEELLVWWIC